MRRKKKLDGLRAINIMNTIQELAFSLFGIFIPIYFLTLGFSLSEVFVYFIIQYVLIALLSFAAVYIANRVGLQQTIIIRLPFLFIFLYLLWLLESNEIPLVTIAIFNAIQTAFYFTPLHIIFAKHAKHKSMGTSMGKYFALPKLAGVLGPFIGALIVLFFSFKALFGLVFVILLIAMIPLIGSKPIKTSFSFNLQQGKKLFKKYPRYFWAEVVDNFGEEADGIIWPIFIFLTFASIVSVGLIGTLVGLGSFLFTILMGKLTDKHKKIQLIKIGALMFVFIWLARYFFDGEMFYYLITVAAGFVMMLFLIPFHSLIYSVSKKNTIDEFLVFREMPVAVGRVIFFSLALIFIGNLKILFLIVGIAYLYFLFLKSQKRRVN